MVPRTLSTAIRDGQSGIARILALLAIFFTSSAGRIVALDPTSHISQYGHSVWRVQDGYFGGMPNSITQTTDGYIWVGTDAGLFRFDGVRFVRWNSQSGEDLPSSRVLTLLGARDGTLWIGTDAGLAHLVSNRLILYQKNEGWSIGRIFQDRDGKIWFGRLRPDDTTHALCQVLDAGVRCFGNKEGVDAYGAGAFAQDISGDLWVGGETTLVRVRPGTSKTYRPRALQSNENNSGVQALAASRDGSLWVGLALPKRGGGLQQMLGGTLKPFVAPKLNGETLNVLSLLSDHDNGLWVGTTRGLYRIRGTDVDHYGSADGLSGDYVYSIFEDREGNVWLGTSQGLDMFRDLRVKSISKREGLCQDGVESVAASRDGNIWIGTSCLQVLGPHGMSSGPGKALPGNQVTSIFEDDAGRLWAGMMNRLFVYERGRSREITKMNGSAVGMVMGITEDSEHTIWVESAGPPGTLFRIQDLKVQQEFPASPEMPLARKIVADPQSGIWLGLVTGDLARYRHGQVNAFAFGHHPNSRVIAIARASDGSILGATGFGVIGWKNGKQQILTVHNGLPCNTANALISDDAGNLWLLAECGLIEVPNDQMKLWWEHPENKLKVRVFDTLDGVQPGLGHFNTSAKTPDGRLWFANGNVVQVIDPAHIVGNTLSPPVHISALIADRKAYPMESALRLPPLTRDLEIDYTALSYVAPQKVLFRYMLEGHDAGWQEPGTRRQAFYSDLRPGRYHFRVIACNNDGVWNAAGASLDFSILPAYYQTAWFRASCAAGFLLLLWGIYRFRVQQLHRQFAIGLEARVNERTRIARELHDTLLQSFHGLMFEFQAARNMFARNTEKAMEALDNAILGTEEAIAEGRHAIKDLRSEPVAHSDLDQSLTSLSQELAASGNASHDSPAFRLVAEGELKNLSPVVQDDVYQIAREALRNAFRHAHAAHVEVEIRCDADEFRLRVRDDGNGIDPAVLAKGGAAGHFGLSGMRERAKQIGAQLNVWSEAGAGTEIQLTIPAAVAYERFSPRSRFTLFRKEKS